MMDFVVIIARFCHAHFQKMILNTTLTTKFVHTGTGGYRK
jgi:hypothetical protein